MQSQNNTKLLDLKNAVSINDPISIKLQEVTKEAFIHRRKMIGKSLKKILTSEQLDKLDIDLSLRPENISVNDYIRIAKALI